MAKLEIDIPNLKLNDGNEIPLLGFGSGTAWYKANPNDPFDKKLVESLKTAILQGWNHLDGAEMYGTETELGQAIKDSKAPREKLFVTTKVFETLEDIPAAIDNSLKKLGLTYVNLYLIHAPYKFQDDAAIQKAWAQMEDVLASGKAKSIGVSNFSVKNIEAILKTAKVRPVMNQVEYHPYLQRRELFQYMKSQDIRMAAFGPQVPVIHAKGGPLDENLEQLAKKYAVSPGEILLRWCIENDVVAVTTSSKEQRMSDYLRACTFSMTPKEVSDIAEIGNEHHFRQYWTDKFDKDDRS